MMLTILRAGSLALAIAAAASTGVAAAPAPEITGVVQRYDRVQNVVYVDGRKYRLVGQAAQALADYVTKHGANSLNGKSVTYSFGLDEQERPYIDNVMY
jgi:hypothetical protein